MFPLNPGLAKESRNSGIDQNGLLNLIAMKLAIKSIPDDNINASNLEHVASVFCKEFIAIKHDLKQNDDEFMHNHRGRSMFS